MGSFFGGSENKSTSESQSVSRPSLPSWVEDALKYLTTTATSQAQTPFPEYPGTPGSRLEGFSPDQQNAFNQVRGYQGSFQPSFDAASAGFNAGSLPVSTGRFTDPGVASAYMSPYIKSVVDPTMDILRQGQAIDQNALRAQATQGGAFGGSRAAVGDAVLRGQQEMTQASTAGNLYNSAYNAGQGAYMSDEARQLQALIASRQGALQGAQGNLAIGTTLPQVQARQASDLLAIGSQNQAQGQALKDINYADFTQKNQYPYGQLSWLSNITGSLPYGSLTTMTNNSQGTQTTPGPGGFQQLAGAALGGLGLAGSLGAFTSTIPGMSTLPGAGGGGNDAGGGGMGQAFQTAMQMAPYAMAFL